MPVRQYEDQLHVRIMKPTTETSCGAVSDCAQNVDSACNISTLQSVSHPMSHCRRTQRTVGTGNILKSSPVLSVGCRWQCYMRRVCTVSGICGCVLSSEGQWGT